MALFAGIYDDVLAAPIEIEGRGLVLQPWQARPYHLISWYDMLEFSAEMFFWCGRALRDIRSDCLVGSITVPGDEPIFALPRDIDDRARGKALSRLEHVEVWFRTMGLTITADTVKEVMEYLKVTPTRRNFQWLIDQVKTVENLARKEMAGRTFIYVPPERAKFFPRVNCQHLFGDAVASAFPSAFYDIVESGTCLAFGRGSACVFHLMRVLEIGLGVLGGKFGVSLAHTNWEPAIKEIESKIRDMRKDPTWKALPDCKDQQEFYAQSASHFGILKDAWRNYTMHARGFYTEEQAERVFENVKGFMQKLAERLSE